MKQNAELPVIERTRDLILWYVPVLNRLPRDHRYVLGERMMRGLYELLEELTRARYAKEKITLLEGCNLQLELLRQQTRLLVDFKLMDAQRFQHVTRLTNEVGVNLGSWLKQQRHYETTRQPVAAGD